MRKLMYIISIVLFSGCTKCQTSGYLAKQTIVVHDLIMFTGESNLRGEADNSGAPSGELGVRNSVRILSNTTKLFQILNIGVNNQSTGGKHGLELALANSADTGLMLPNSPVYIVKTAVGGSTISEWVVGSANWNAMVSLTDTAIVQLTRLNSGTPPKLFIWYGQGQNDYGIMDGFVWKDSTKLHFAQLRAKYGATVPIFMTYLPEPTFVNYNYRITEICNELPYTYAINTPPVIDNGPHWNYANFLVIAYQFILTMKSYYPYR